MKKSENPRGLKALLAQGRLRALRRLHYLLWDRRFERFETVPTGGFLMQQHLDPTDSTNLALAREYLPSPRLVVGWLLAGLREDFSRFTFVDFGSGKGRVLLAAAEKPFRAVRGVEFSEGLHREAERNIAGYPTDRMACGDVKSWNIDAANFELPDGDCILYFFNPFGAVLRDHVVSTALDRAQSRNSRIILVFYNPVDLQSLVRQERLQRRTIPLPYRLKLKVLSPYPAEVFELKPVPFPNPDTQHALVRPEA